MNKQKYRIVIRPWIPRRLPYAISEKQLADTLAAIKPFLKQSLYIGWGKRKVENKSQTLYLIATGDTSMEARNIFKKSTEYGKDIWVIRP